MGYAKDMTIISSLLTLTFLFYALGRSADTIIYNLRRIGAGLGLNLFFLGIVLGLFTSLPEFAVGVNATINNVPSMATGNLFGGLFVLFGLILGSSLILNRSVRTTGSALLWPLAVLYLVAPFFLSLDGNLSSRDGTLLITAYIALLFYASRIYKHRRRVLYRDQISAIFWVITGLVLVIVVSNIIVRTTLTLLTSLGLPPFAIGLLVFSIGTNLPEIIVMLRSWRRHARALSVSSLLGSALANVCILGFLAVMRPLPITIDASFIIMTSFLLALVLLLFSFASTARRLTRSEGVVLLGIYVLFVATQLWLLKIQGPFPSLFSG